jgi:hypothetical protein
MDLRWPHASCKCGKTRLSGSLSMLVRTNGSNRVSEPVFVAKKRAPADLRTNFLGIRSSWAAVLSFRLRDYTGTHASSVLIELPSRGVIPALAVEAIFDFDGNPDLLPYGGEGQSRRIFFSACSSSFNFASISLVSGSVGFFSGTNLRIA